ncbi:MAG: Uma2 family endonuclease, partial [Deltaproteobacteria bacterium]|nr:Uma2 family endonuclease [Deltaproteobacteria bacterium]
MSSISAHSIPQGKIVLTYEDYCELPNDRNRYEIHDGELSVTPAPNVKHQRFSSRLHFALFQHVLANQLGEVFAAPTDVILAPTTVVQPDLVFIG